MSPRIDQDRDDFDPATYLVVPGGAEVIGWKTDARGYYQAAKLVLFCYGSVPEDYRIYHPRPLDRSGRPEGIRRSDRARHAHR